MLKERLLNFLKLDGLIEHLAGYFETRVELLKVEAKEEGVRLGSKLLLGLLIAFTVVFFLLLGSFATAYAIGEKLGTSIGFVIVGGFYLLITVLLVVFKDAITTKFEKILIDVMQKKK